MRWPSFDGVDAMPIDNEKLGKFMAESMEELSNQHGEDADLGEVLIIVEVNRPSTLEDYLDEDDFEEFKDDTITEVIYRCTNDKRWAHYGLMSAAMDAAKEGA